MELPLVGNMSSGIDYMKSAAAGSLLLKRGWFFTIRYLCSRMSKES